MPKYILFLHSKSCVNTRKIYFDSLINNLQSMIENMIENIEKKWNNRWVFSTDNS